MDDRIPQLTEWFEYFEWHYPLLILFVLIVVLRRNNK